MAGRYVPLHLLDRPAWSRGYYGGSCNAALNMYRRAILQIGRVIPLTGVIPCLVPLRSLYYRCAHLTLAPPLLRVRVQLIGHFEPCMTEIYLHIVARMAD